MKHLMEITPSQAHYTQFQRRNRIRRQQRRERNYNRCFLNTQQGISFRIPFDQATTHNSDDEVSGEMNDESLELEINRRTSQQEINQVLSQFYQHETIYNNLSFK